MVQEQRVLKYMKKNDGITRLSAKIFNLRKQGFDIKGVMQQGENRYGEITHFKRYMLINEEAKE